MRALSTGRERRVAPRRPLREVVMYLCALAVVAAMVFVSETARDSAVRHQQAQVLVERVRAASQQLAVLADVGVSQSAGQPSAHVNLFVTRAMAVFGRLKETLGDVRASSAGADTARIAGDINRLYVIGSRDMAGFLGANAAGAMQGARAALDPALSALDRDSAAAAKRQASVGAAALARADLAYNGSLVIGLLLLLLLGAGLLRQRRRALLIEHRRSLDARTEERVEALVEHLSDVITVIGPDLTVRWQSGSVTRTLGHAPDAMLGQRLTAYVHPADLATVEHHLLAAIRAGTDGTGSGALTFTARTRHGTGEWRHLEVVADNRLGDPAVDGLILSMRDVTERTRLEDELRHQAFHDTLTGLANRALFEDRLTHALATARRIGRPLAVLFLDLDDFKTINDSLGHSVGDELLRTVAVRIAATVRASDTAARLGGDEFAILLDPMDGGVDPRNIAERLLEALVPPVHVAGRTLRITASVGVAAGDGAIGVDELLRNADTAMYAAKDAGKNTLQAFDEGMHWRVVERLEMTGELQSALQRDEFELDYQPIVALSSRRLAGVEALVRWAHPTRGRLGPLEFIPLAEETGLIAALGDWVLRAACREGGRWEAKYPDRVLRIGVNVSARQLLDDGLPGLVAEALRDGGLSPNRLVLEITESLLPEDTETTMVQLGRLKRLGVQIALDDFGTGYSSLARLHNYPIDILKIDRSFIAQLEADPAAGQLVRGVVNLSDGLELDVVAEGIETDEQAAMLRRMRVSHAQGYLFSRPVAPAAIDALLLGETLSPVPTAG